LLEALPNGRVVALDLSQNMLRSAREYLQPQFGKRTQFVAADLPDLPFENAFDGIVSTAAFHWVLDHDRLFRNLHGALRPGGWLQAQCGGGPNIANLRERMAGLAASPTYAAFLAGFPSPCSSRMPKVRLIRCGVWASSRSRLVLNRLLPLWKVASIIRNS